MLKNRKEVLFIRIVSPLEDLKSQYVYITYLDGTMEKAIFKSWEGSVLKFIISGKDTYIFEHAILKLVKS